MIAPLKVLLKCLRRTSAAARAIYGDQSEPRTTLRALNYFVDGDLPKLPASMHNVLRTAATGVKLDELPRAYCEA